MKTDVFDKKGSDKAEAWQKSGSSQPEMSKEEMMKKMEAAGAPGPSHKALEAFVGNWKAEVKCGMESGGSPQVTQGTAKAKWVFNGRFVEEEFHGQMMGKPFTGRMLLGFDNVKQTFNSIWVSDTQTSIFASEGKGADGNKVITLEGKASCPVSGRKDMSMKTVWRVISNDKHIMEMYNGADGSDAKTMEITYTRE